MKKHLHPILRALGSRNYRIFFAAQAVSLTTDIVMHYEMIKFEEMIDSGSLLNAVKEIIPDLK